MGYYYQGQTLAVQLPEEIKDHQRRGRVKVAGGLIRQEDVRIIDQGPADGHPLHLPTGELSWQVISSLFQSHHLQDPVNLVPASVLVAKKQGQLYILPCCQGRHEMELLKDEADVLPAQLHQISFRKAADFCPIQLQMASCRCVQAADDVEQCRLTGAGRADDGDEFTLVRPEIHILQSMDLFSPAAVYLGQAVGHDYALHSTPPRIASMGVSREDLKAGYRPQMRPKTTEKTSAKAISSGLKDTSDPFGE